MERLNERLAQADHALLLEEQEVNTVIRDAAIQRFESSYEAVWKAAQRYLRVIEGIEEGLPKAVTRACVRTGILRVDDGRVALAMVDDRNLTSHTYNKSLAEKIYRSLPEYARLMRRWLETIGARVESV
ncbi:MAG: nucleotidyltransferase [Methanobacteriota archaeon]|nr:MAG: nucleotidyltransferase [Euryarchaeota archaeon]